jgi:uncharacterized iron-regulated membrane protein
MFAIHRWLGIHLGVPLFVVCSSGALAVLGYEWDWLADPARRVEATEVDWAAVGRTLDEELDHLRPISVDAPAEPGHAVVATAEAPRRQLQFILLDPESGAVTGRRSVLSVQVYLRQFHKTFVAPYGLYLVTLLGFALLVSAATGIVVHRRFWRHAFRLRRGSGLRVLVADAHRTLGLWSLLLALVVAVTGVWYFAEAAARDVADASVEPEPPKLSPSRLAALGPTPRPLGIGALVDAARREMPDLRVRRVRLPHEADAPVQIDGQTGALLVRDRASRVYLDPYSGRVLGTQRAERLGALHRWSDTADPLHFGDFGGLASKLLWFVLGILLSVAVLAGPALAELRRRQRAKKPSGPRVRLLRPSVLVSGGLASLGLIAAVIASALGYGGTLVAGHPPASRVAGPVSVGPWRLVVSEHRDAGDDRGVLIVRALGGHAHWQRASLLDDAGELVPVERGRAWARAEDVRALRVEPFGGEALEAPLRFGPADAPEAREALQATGLAEPALEAPTYVLVFIFALLLFELAGVLFWLWLAWRASSPGGGSRGRRSEATSPEGASSPASTPSLAESYS